VTDSLQPEWKAFVFKGVIYGIYRLPGAAVWRYLKEKGKKRVFPNEQAARNAARERALAILFPALTGTMPLNEKKVAESLGVEEWLKSKREDLKARKLCASRAQERQ
jgi:glutathione S-transferase